MSARADEDTSFNPDSLPYLQGRAFHSYVIYEENQAQRCFKKFAQGYS